MVSQFCTAGDLRRTGNFFTQGNRLADGFASCRFLDGPDPTTMTDPTTMKTNSFAFPFTLVVLFADLFAGLFLTAPSAFAVTASEAAAIATPADPMKVLGNDACVKCHASEIQVWKSTPHARTFDELHRRPEAKAIASKLGLSSIKNEGRCVACHYTQQFTPASDVHVIAGVSCESCHGAGKDWLDVHADYGGEGITRLSESESHRRSRIAKSVALGMRNPANVYSVAKLSALSHDRRRATGQRRWTQRRQLGL